MIRVINGYKSAKIVSFIYTDKNKAEYNFFFQMMQCDSVPTHITHRCILRY